MNHKDRLDNQLRRELIYFLSDYPPLTTSEGREAWLLNLPKQVRGLIPKRSDCCEYDLAFIIDAINSLQFKDGSWPLLILIDAVLKNVEGLTIEAELETLRRRIESDLERIRSEHIQRMTRVYTPRACPATWQSLIRVNRDFARLIQRDELAEEILEYFTETPASEVNPVVLYGEPMAGKTGILSRLCEVLRDEYVPLVVTVQGSPLSNLDDFLCDLASQLTTTFNMWANHNGLSARLRDPKLEDFVDKDGITAFAAHWDHLRRAASGKQPVVMFDEIERLLDQPHEIDRHILAFLIDFLHDPGNGCFVLAGSERIRCSGNEHFNALIAEGRLVRVPYFDEEIVASCFSTVQDYFILEGDVLRYIAALCDGHPRVLRHFYEVIASLVNQSPGKQEVERSDIEPIVINVIERTRDVLLALWQRLSPCEQAVVELISRKPVLLDPASVFECRLGELLYLADERFGESTTACDGLGEGVADLAERELVEWKDRDEGLFRFRLGILPLWRCYGRIMSMRSRGWVQ